MKEDRIPSTTRGSSRRTSFACILLKVKFEFQENFRRLAGLGGLSVAQCTSV